VDGFIWSQIWTCVHSTEPSESIRGSNFLTLWVTINFSRRILLYGVRSQFLTWNIL
jgi:hypothetical protein